MVDYSQLSDEELKAMYSKKKNYSSMSNDELKSLYSQKQGYVEKTQPINGFMDTARGFLSGLSTIPRGIENLQQGVSNAVVKAISGKDNPFDQRVLKPLEYEPQTFSGKAADFIGGTVPYLATKAVTLPAQTALGAGIGAVESLAREDKPLDVAINTGIGAAGGAIGGGAIKLAGKVFEKAMPVFGRISGVKSSNMERAIERIKEGGTIFGKNQDEVDAMVNEALETMRVSGNLSRNEIDDMTNSIIEKYAKGTPINPQASAVKPQIKELRGDLDLATEYGGVRPQTAKLVQDDMFFYNMRKEFYNQVDDENPLLPEETKQAIVDTMIQKSGLKSNATAQAFGEGEINPVSLHQIKSKIQHDVEFNKENKSYNKQGEALLREVQNAYGNVLKERFPAYSPAMKEYADSMAAKDFDKWVKTGSVYEIGRALTPILGGVAGFGLTGNPLFTVLSLMSSPKAQRYMLDAYSFSSRNITPRAVSTTTGAAEQFIPKRREE